MGEANREENKGEEKKEEAKDEKNKEEEKKEELPEIVLKVDMHCEACARKVAKALKGFEGVEDVATDSKASKVVVKGKTADPIKVCERLQKKSGRKVELISPLPKPPPEEKKEENKEPKEEKKEEPPAAITVVLNVRMHCEACAQVLQRRIRKIQGVESVEADVGNDKVIVKGVVDPTKLVYDVNKRTRKQASIVKDEEKKEEEKKEEKEEKEGEKKEGEEGKGEDDKKSDIKRSEYYPSKYYSEFAYPQIFSDENPNACSLM
ncbi:heavy metal-associated isoprenylated plant protein 7-like isoform X2 [Durio zibethinus]|uniref:Heavy metal-associated isoprenylated plant protein 7-like isoform X2 n=1 Tax=Durio zibethinus TaxID=66656 RepID=A0A6P5WJD0_DURZI|nr:heavy metal-associated isoprenylated plant protein 7-like isoform X2 [Durio zibethinus]